MSLQKGIRFTSMLEFWEQLPGDERIIVDVLRQIILSEIPDGFQEKLTNNVPYYFGKKRVCMIWPASVPGGGIRSGVLLGFSYGNRLQDRDGYLDHGKNKRIFYKIFHTPEEIDLESVVSVLREAIELDRRNSRGSRAIS
jgi:hypothetical protein